MTREVTSKHIDGIADLVVVAPIKEGFIDAYENVTFETRLRIVGEALHGLRVAAREFEPDTPFSDVTERILTLLDFRIVTHDDDLFQIDPSAESKAKLKPRSYLYLAATFDGALEPYMRLIWRPLGVFLDLLFCNCEEYKPAGDHGFPDYFNWVKKAQRESAIFYSTTGATVRDQIYLRSLERMQRQLGAADADLALCRLTMPDREAEAEAARSGINEPRAHKLALEALNVLYRLADYYPPDRLDPSVGPPPPPAAGKPADYTYAEGRYLLRAARSLLLGWDTRRLPAEVRTLYKDQLDWFESRADLASQEPVVPDPQFDDREVQSGILTSPGTVGRLVRQGALLLMTVTDPVKARSFIAQLPICYEGGPPPDKGLYHTIAFTAHGLTELGLYESKRLRFPKEFREGMEKRAGLLGDFRENHPRNWTLPERNWPPLPPGPTMRRPPIEMSEIDFVIQLRYAVPLLQQTSDTVVHDEIVRLATLARESGAVLAGYEPLVSIYEDPRPGGDPPDALSGHFKLRDGISQPVPRAGLRELDLRGRDDVRLGEMLCGYRNDRGDQAPRPDLMNSLQRNGSFLVIRKLKQEVDKYFKYLDDESQRIATEYQIQFGPEDLAARLWGRMPDGTPLAPHKPGSLNEFDYSGDAEGDACPYASHIRRSNPREGFLGRPAPRIMRRGMSYGEGPNDERGVMFMAYCASIAEQFEVVQRWVNGGNSTGIASANNDPLVGVPPAKGDPVHRFVVDGKVIRTVVPRDLIKLQWGLYLFAPSKSGLDEICGFTGDVRDMDEPRETRGKKLIAMLDALPPALQRLEWKQILEDFDSKDPAERNRAPDIWSAIRWYKGGAYRLPFGQAFAKSIRGEDAPGAPPDPGKEPSVILVASRKHVSDVLGQPEIFSVEIQDHRIGRTSGRSYVAMQPGTDYDRESPETNRIMFAKTSEEGFQAGYANAKKVLAQAILTAKALGRDSFKMELRRDFIMLTLAGMCTEWFGLPDPDELLMEKGAWSWAGKGRKARCPGDFLSPSRHAFYAEAPPIVEHYASEHGALISEAGRKLVAQYRETGHMPGVLSAEMAAKIDGLAGLDRAGKDDLLARNIIGMMIGFLPPADGNLRSILYEWLTERTLWRHQAALRRAAEDGPANHKAAMDALWPPIARAMGKRPVPDLLLRVATRDHQLTIEPADPADAPKGFPDFHAATADQVVQVSKGDVVLASLASATQRALRDPDLPNGDPSFVFGGERKKVPQEKGKLFHACPAYELMRGSITGILAALLDAGQIKAMPSSLIVEISNWKAPS